MAAQVLSSLALTERALIEPWRLLTCHFVHWGWEHAAWNGVAFLCPFLVLPGPERRRLAWSLLAVAPLLSLGLLLFLAGGSYAGLSGLACAGWAFAGLSLVLDREQRWIGLGFLVLLMAKIGLEGSMPGPLLIRAEVWSNLPAAHVLGAAMGAMAGWTPGRFRGSV